MSAPSLPMGKGPGGVVAVKCGSGFNVPQDLPLKTLPDHSHSIWRLCLY